MAVTIIKETGAGVAGANSYEDVAGMNAYFEGRVPAAVAAADDDQKAAALIVGTIAVDSTWQSRWPGYRKSSTQTLCFPRDLCYSWEGHQIFGVPPQVPAATCEYAAEHLRASLTTAQDRDGRISSASLGELSVSFESGAPGRAPMPMFIYQLMSPVVGPPGRMVPA